MTSRYTKGVGGKDKRESQQPVKRILLFRLLGRAGHFIGQHALQPARLPLSRSPGRMPGGGVAHAIPAEFRRPCGNRRCRQLLDLRGLEDPRGSVRRRILQILTGRKDGKWSGRWLIEDFRVGNCCMRETPGESGGVDQGRTGVGEAGIKDRQQRFNPPGGVQQATKTSTLV